MLLNRERATQVMEKHGLDGLVAAFPENIYYLTDYFGPAMLMARNYLLYAVLPKDPSAPAALIIPSTMVYHLEHTPTWVPNVVGFGTRVTPGAIAAPRDSDSTVEEYEEEGAPPPHLVAPHDPMPYPTREGGVMAARDRQLIARYDRYRGKLEPSSLYGLRRALLDAGIAKGRIGFDDPRVLGWLGEIGMKSLSGIDALNIFKEVRIVKSEPEIALLTKAGRMSEQAINDVIDAMHVGMPLDAISDIHAQSLARQGGRAAWIIANIRGLATGEVEANELIKLDSVGTYKEYRGDVGRSVYFGEPTEEMLTRNRAVMRGLAVAYENIRPGIPARQIVELALKTVRSEGFPGFVFGAPHSVGLEHTDHPVSLGPEMPGVHELVFEENMVFTLDMPYHEFGWGTMHVEDMIIVRKDGCEPITSMDTALRVKPI